jgi:hypothetical protein
MMNLSAAAFEDALCTEMSGRVRTVDPYADTHSDSESGPERAGR